MKKYVFLIIGILCLIASFIWMCISKNSKELSFILAAISGAVIREGIHRIKRK